MDRKLSPAWQWGVVLLLVVTLPLLTALALVLMG